MDEQFPKLLTAATSDLLNALGSSWATLGGELFGAAIRALLQRRAEAARDILLDELRYGQKTIDGDEVEEAVAIAHRYARAAQEGAARVNLRLLAQVIAAQARRGNLIADEFLYYADILASLRYEELVLVGTLYRHWIAEPAGSSRDDAALKATKSELIPDLFRTEDNLTATASAAMRTGLITALSGWGSLVYTPTPLMDKMNSIVSIEAAIAAEAGYTPSGRW